MLAEIQLLCRLSFTKRNLAQAKGFNEAAIASAQQSGDKALLGATIGHLAHFYQRFEQAPEKASRCLEEAQTDINKGALAGWFFLLSASIAAMRGDEKTCEGHLFAAWEGAHQTEHPDPYFTDFNVTSVKVFAGNCLLTVGKHREAVEWLSGASREELSPNRHASTYYDLARAHAASNQLEEAQQYAIKSIERAVATDNLYIIPRCLHLASAIQQKDPGNPHASTIVEYALSVF
jgi:tetratricopeptide (TPR) repeat protein